jgi:hypothetical protein
MPIAREEIGRVWSLKVERLFCLRALAGWELLLSKEDVESSSLFARSTPCKSDSYAFLRHVLNQSAASSGQV